uniref:Reverse transcriptase domain-containing protein n=1 Tax=Amphiprion ocellaris TaxID=80972 RepID=A0A3Q1CL96_AMPOC
MVNSREHKVALYADDILLYLSNPDFILTLLDLLKTFGAYSGYKLNIGKTQIMSFNYSPSTDWSQKAVKYLGVWLTDSPDDLYKKNFDSGRKWRAHVEKFLYKL